MPPRRPARRAARKPTVARAKQIVAKTTKAKAKKNMDTFFLKARTQVTAIPTQGVVVANYLSLFFDLMNATAVQGVTQNAEFNLYRQLYDKVRINSIKITVQPKANMFTQDAAQNDAQLTLSGDGLVHTAVDRDGAAPGSIARLQRYGSYKKYSVMKPFTRSYSVKYPTGVWLDTDNIYSDSTLLQRLGVFGGITLYAENLVEDKLEIWNEPWANIHIEYNCVFQGKTSASLSVGEDGTVTVSPQETVPLVAYSPLVNIRGSIADTRVSQDASGNFVDTRITDST